MLQPECRGKEGPASKGWGMQVGCTGEVRFDIARVPQAQTRDHTTSRLQGGYSLTAEGLILSSSHWGPCRNKAARCVDETHSGNYACYPHSPGWGHQGYIHGHSDHLGGESGPWEPLHGGQPPRTHHGGYHWALIGSKGRWLSWNRATLAVLANMG